MELVPREQSGYQFVIRGNENRVALTVHRGLAMASYSAPDRMIRHRIYANFDGFGELSLRFKSSGKSRKQVPLSGCKGPPIRTYFGAFVGRLNFTGEENYVRLRARRVRGAWSSDARWNCKKRRNRESTKGKRLRPSVSAFVASSRAKKMFFAALSRSESLFTSFLVGINERRGQTRVERIGLSLGEARDYVREKGNASIAVTPPPPFSGTATFQQGVPKSVGWGGSLSVSLPGAKHIALTGPGITARLPGHSDVRRLLDLLNAF